MTNATDRSGAERIKSAQATNFGRLNALVEPGPFGRHLRFLNFGYRPLPGEEPAGPPLPRRFPNPESAQLLFQVVGNVDLRGRDVVEIGCGRGGNLWLARAHLKPRSVIGIDLTESSIRFCRQAMPELGSGFLVGDAEVLPVGDAGADIVLSVESSCTYPDLERFIRELGRVVRPGGHLLHTDLLPVDLVDAFVSALEACGFRLDDRRDITANVRAARESSATRQSRALARRDRPSSDAVAEWVGGEGSELRDRLNDGHSAYVVLRFTKLDSRTPPTEPLLDDAQRAMARSHAQVAARLLALPSGDAGLEP